MEDKVIGYKITVEYCCKNMIELENLLQAFNNDVNAVWQFISDKGRRHPLDFADTWDVIKVEPMDELKL